VLSVRRCCEDVVLRDAKGCSQCLFEIKPVTSYILERDRLVDWNDEQKYRSKFITFLTMTLPSRLFFCVVILSWVCTYACVILKVLMVEGPGQVSTRLEQSYCWYNGSSGITEQDPYQVHLAIPLLSRCLLLMNCREFFLRNGSNCTWLMITAGVWCLLIPTEYLWVFFTRGLQSNGELRLLKSVVLEGVITHLL